MPFTVTRSFQMPVWNEEIRNQVKDFWQARRVRFVEESDRVMRAQRNNLSHLSEVSALHQLFCLPSSASSPPF